MAAKQWGSLGYIDPEDALNGAADTVYQESDKMRPSVMSLFGGGSKTVAPQASGGGGIMKLLLIAGVLGGGYFLYKKYGKKGRK